MTMLETITVDGFPPHKSITITISAEEAVRTASLDLVIIGSGVPIAPGKATTIKASGDLVMTGYARDVNASHDAETRTLTVSLVSKTVDATECSVVHPTGECIDKDLSQIAKEFDTLKIGVETDGELPKEPRHKLRPGESLFHTLERRARGRGILIHDTPEGKLKLATKPAGTHSGGLVFGQNIKEASSSLTERGRHSEIRVRGQTTTGTGKQQLRSEAVARDAGVKRRRPLVIHHEGETTTSRMKKRSQWQAKRGAGNGTTASVTATGWRDAGGKIWTPNWLVHVEDEWIGINGMMIIKTVTLNQDDNGTTAVISLADPRALGGENPRGKTSEAFAAPAVADAEYSDE